MKETGFRLTHDIMFNNRKQAIFNHNTAFFLLDMELYGENKRIMNSKLFTLIKNDIYEFIYVFQTQSFSPAAS